MGPLDGQVALITGCGRYQGLGRAIALALATAGADVAVTDIAVGGTRNVSESGTIEQQLGWKGLDSLVDEVEEMGRRAVAITGDVGRPEDVDRMVTTAVEELGGVDILVNNAAAPHGADRDLTWKVPVEAFEMVMRVNTTGVFLMSTAVTRHLLGRGSPGRILNITSGAGRRGVRQRGAYCASKFAVHGLTETMALELAPHGITVNAVAPGAMKTARQASRAARTQEGVLRGEAAPPPVPVGRVGLPEDVARTIVFLADPAADYITGQVVGVDGGVGVGL